MARPRYSLILVTCDHLEQTVRCVNSLLRTVDGDAEMIFVDNGSTDGTRSYLEEICGRFAGRTETILLEHNQGWCGGINAGLQCAGGDYLVLLNNDLVLTEGWLQGLRRCMDHAHEELPGFSRAGLVGPVSNSVGGPQHRPTAHGAYDVGATLESFADGFRRQQAAAWQATHFLSGFCLMMRRECHQQVGGLELDFAPGGFDDNDLVLRAQQRGWSCYVAGDVFVHHEGSVTFHDLFPEKHCGLANLERFYRKWRARREGPRRLVAVYRVKDCADTIGQSLDSTATFADAICVLDDGSSDGTETICQEHPAVTRCEHQQLPFDERRDRNRLLELAAEQEPDWVIAVDGDEIFEMDRPRAQRLMHLADPHIKVLGFHWYTFWEPTHSYFRADGIFGRMSGLRMYRWEPNQRIVLGTPEGLHCGNIPQFPPGARHHTNVRVRHLGYDSDRRRESKLKFYLETDRDPDPQLVGNDDYSHLVSPTVTLRRYPTEHGLSLCIITKNEQQQLERFLSFWEPYVDEICVTDTGSSDRTLRIAERFTDRITRQQAAELDLAAARNQSLQMARCPWILSLDPDEQIALDDLPALQRLTDDEEAQAFVFAVDNHQKDTPPVVTSAIRLFRNREQIRYTRPVHETVEQSLQKLGLSAWPAGIRIQHHGYLKSDEQVQQKLDAYFHCNRRYQQQHPDDPVGYYNEALHHLNEDREEQAIEYLEQTLAVDPSFVSALGQMALVYQERAMRIWQAVLERTPPDHPLQHEARRALGHLHPATPRRPVVGIFRNTGDQGRS